jgi:hypothetical protein
LNWKNFKGISMETNDSKKPRVRSIAYPSYTIRQSSDLVKRINQEFGNTIYNKREHIAEQLGMSVGNLLMKLSSAVQYGLLEMKSGEGYKPASLFTRIYKPLNEEEKREAEIQCLLNAELHKQLYEQHKGRRLPNIGGLSILLFRNYKVAEDASERAAKIFYENLKDLELIGEENLVIDFSESVAEDVKQESENIDSIAYLPEPTKSQVKQEAIVDISSQMVDAPPIPIFVKGGVARLIMPSGFDADDLETVIEIISVYKKQKSKAAT